MLKTMSGLGDMIGNTQSIIYIGCSAYSSVLNTGSKVLMQGELFQRCSHFSGHRKLLLKLSKLNVFILGY